MQVKMQDGSIVEIPDGLSREEQRRYLLTYVMKPNVVERIGGLLEAGAGDLAHKVGNLAGTIGVDDRHKAFTELGDALQNLQLARTVEAQPATSIPGQLASGLVRFAPELPLWMVGEGAIFGAAKAIPYLRAGAKALQGVKGEAFLKDWAKAVARAGITGGGVGTATAEPGSTTEERMKHGVEEAVGFGAGVGALHPVFRLFGYLLGKGAKTAVDLAGKEKLTPEDVARIKAEGEAAAKSGDKEAKSIMDMVKEEEAKERAAGRRSRGKKPPEGVGDVGDVRPPGEPISKPPTEPMPVSEPGGMGEPIGEVPPVGRKKIKLADGSIKEIKRETPKFWVIEDNAGKEIRISKNKAKVVDETAVEEPVAEEPIIEEPVVEEPGPEPDEGIKRAEEQEAAEKEGFERELELEREKPSGGEVPIQEEFPVKDGRLIFDDGTSEKIIDGSKRTWVIKTESGERITVDKEVVLPSGEVYKIKDYDGFSWFLDDGAGGTKVINKVDARLRIPSRQELPIKQKPVDYTGDIVVEHDFSGQPVVKFGYIAHHYPLVAEFLNKGLTKHIIGEPIDLYTLTVHGLNISKKSPREWKDMTQTDVGTNLETLEGIYRLLELLYKKASTNADKQFMPQVEKAFKEGIIDRADFELYKALYDSLKVKPNGIELMFDRNPGDELGTWNRRLGLLKTSEVHTMCHEFGHWGFDIALTPGERIKVFRGLIEDLKSGKGSKDFLTIPPMYIVGKVFMRGNNYDNLLEVFADMFRQHILHNVEFPKYQAIINKVVKLFGDVLRKYRASGYEPGYMKEAFDKIIDIGKLKGRRRPFPKDLSTIGRMSKSERNIVRSVSEKPADTISPVEKDIMKGIVEAIQRGAKEGIDVVGPPTVKRRRVVEGKKTKKADPARMLAIKEAIKRAKDKGVLKDRDTWLVEEPPNTEPEFISLEELERTEGGRDWETDEFVGPDGELRELDFTDLNSEIKKQTIEPKDLGVDTDVGELSIPAHYKQFKAWMKENSLRPRSEYGYQAAWELYKDKVKQGEAYSPESPIGQLYKELRKKLSDAARLESEATDTMVEIQGENGTQSLKQNVDNDILPYLKNYLTSPFTWAKKGPEWLMDKVCGVIKGQMVARYNTNVHNYLISEIERLVKTKEGRLRIRDIMEGKVKPHNPEEAEAAIRVRDWLDTMRLKYQEHLKKMYTFLLSKKQRAALSDLIMGHSPESVAKTHGIKMDVIEDIFKEYKAIEKWGLDDYVTKVERGSIAMVTESGDLVGWVLSPKHGRELGIAYLKAHPEVKTLYLDNKRPFENAIGVTAPHYHAIQNKLIEELEGYAKDIKVGMLRAAAKKAMPKAFTIKPSPKFSQFAQPTKGILKGEQDIFPLLRSYAHSMELKMELDPIIYESQKLLPTLPENLRKAFSDVIEDAKGKYYMEDRLADSILGVISRRTKGKIGSAPLIATRVVGKVKMVEAYTKFAYRPIAGMINWASGFMHIWVKTSVDAMMKAHAWQKTAEGIEFIREVAPMLGVDIMEHATEGGSVRFQTKIGKKATGGAGGITQYLKDISHPMGFFQRPEGPLRELCAATNYLLALEKGATKEAAKEFAVRSVWFQEFTYNTAALPKILRSPAGRLVGQFKPYLIKELEFIGSLTGPELAKYMVGQVLLGGPRGFMYLLRSLPIIGTVAGWNQIEEWMDKNAPRASRGIGGFLGVDITAPAVFQFPNRFEDWSGPFFSDLINFKKTVMEPIFHGERLGPNQTFLTPWTSAPSELKEWAEGTVPILRHWDNIFEQMVDKDGWIKNERGQRLFHIGDSAYEHMAFYMKTAMGAESLESAVTRRASSRERQERTVRNRNKSKLVDEVLNTLHKGESLSESQYAELVEYNINPSSLRRAEKFRHLSPYLQEMFRTELARRYQLLSDWPELEGHQAGSRRTPPTR